MHYLDNKYLLFGHEVHSVSEIQFPQMSGHLFKDVPDL